MSEPLSKFVVAVVGGGFSGTVLAARLVAESRKPLVVRLFDRDGAFGAGLAYSTDDPLHFLNVPAERMSALAEEPSHFIEWLERNGIQERGEHGHTFTPRRNYRRYLQSLLSEAVENPGHPDSRLDKIEAEVVSVEPGFTLLAADGSPSHADFVVLATGYRRDSGLSFSEALDSAVASPFQPESWPKAGVKHAVIAGSSLTALDAAASLFARYPGVTVTCVSRHGRWPQPHLYEPRKAAVEIPAGELTIRGLVRQIRRAIRQAELDGGSWHSVFDTLRPQWEGIWQRLPERERTRFVTHVQRIFDGYRHRIPPPLDEFLQPFRDSGALRVRRGRLLEIRPGSVLVGNDSSSEELAADLVLDCTGFSANLAQSGEPLHQALLIDGFATVGSMGLGLRLGPDGNVHGHPRVFALGPLRRGDSWETTAVPEIRQQISAVSTRIVAIMDSF